VDGEPLPTTEWPRLDRFREHDIDLPVGTLPVQPEREAELRRLLDKALALGKGRVRAVIRPLTSNPSQTPTQSFSPREKAGMRGSKEERGSAEETLYSTERACPGCGRSFDELDPRLFSYNSRQGWCPGCYGTGVVLSGFDAEQSGEERRWGADPEQEERVCPDCHGHRLRPEALAVRFQGRGIAELSALPVSQAAELFNGLRLCGREEAIARDLLVEIRSRLGFLESVGLPYLGLNRAAPSLSGGEAQRIRLAAQLGSNLRGVCYILDEPTIGLHPRDNQMLLETLQRLEAKGNTVVVVEHDEETIRRAGHLVDFGPGAGIEGGRVVARGSVEQVMRSPESVTGRFLAEPLRHPLQPRRRVDTETPRLSIKGADLHNLQELDLEIPLGRLVCVSGVSGSGKSTLVREVLHAGLKRRLAGELSATAGCRAIGGWEPLQRVLEVDQTPIGKTPRSCPATYVGFFDPIRRLFAATTEARMRGFGPGRFSFNVKGGRCEACEGQGARRIEMSFLPDVQVPCEVCGGKRFNPETLAVRFKGKSIAEVLSMNVEQALESFSAHPSIHRPLSLLRELGLGYLTLGQRSPTLSGGEAQRIKLVTELAKSRPAAESPKGAKQTLYILDEPTIGLHMADEEKLIRALHRLVDAGNTVLLIEHSLDLIAEADWLIDLGPEGGDGGGRVVAEGTPEAVAEVQGSHTARFLRPFLEERSK
jgi:excinuclease ABC subunit A